MGIWQRLVLSVMCVTVVACAAPLACDGDAVTRKRNRCSECNHGGHSDARADTRATPAPFANYQC
jgi:hypothetical protein